MEHIVLDANVVAASFPEEDKFHQESQTYIEGLESGDYTIHLPMLVMVEVVSAIWRRTQKQGMAFVTRARTSLQGWESSGRLVPYPLDERRMALAMDAAIKYRLSGADSIVSFLADELDMPFVTFDSTLQRRVPRASA